MNRNDAIGGALIFLFGGLTAYLSTRMPIGNFRAAGSGLFPLCLGLLLMGLSSIYTIEVLLRDGRLAGKKTQAAEIGTSPKRVIAFMAAIALAVALLRWLGYPLTSFLLVLGLLRVFGRGTWTWDVFIAFLASAICYFLFVQWLKIPFPKGWLGL